MYLLYLVCLLILFSTSLIIYFDNIYELSNRFNFYTFNFLDSFLFLNPNENKKCFNYLQIHPNSNELGDVLNVFNTKFSLKTENVEGMQHESLVLLIFCEVEG